tara:strand:- start:135 stop:494 length:360 start_codon:yes stop_codon:yes gene_type:complete
MKKIFVFLLLLNFITTLSVGYVVYEKASSKKATIIELEPPIQGDIDELLAVDKEFKKNVYEGMARLMYGQNMINLRLFALHHYIKPHGASFIEGCPECELEKQKIIEEEKESITLLEAG